MNKKNGKFILIVLLFCNSVSTNAQQNSIRESLLKISGIQIEQLYNAHFNQYFEIHITQPVDHFNPFSATFSQRIYFGFNSLDSVTVMDTDGYENQYASRPDYENELAALLHANLIAVEHHYCGESVPDSLNYNFLTLRQVAADDHAIKLLFEGLLKNKWISTGISKGGQAALAYKYYYPEDVSATVLYGAAVKKSLNETKVDSMLNALSQTPCGKQLEAFQLAAFKNKAALIPLLNDFVIANHISFTQFELETYLDYMLLEFPFSFWQEGNTCKLVPPADIDPKTCFNYIVHIVPPRFFSDKNLKRLEPAFYMSYHELGYYEYNTEKFKHYLKESNYSNKNFVPKNVNVDFDPTYLNAINKFLQTNDAKSIVFVYGEFDPWSAMQQVYKANKVIVPNGSHKSRIKNLNNAEKEKTIRLIHSFL
ncbi:MAG: hypothetical protein JWP12_124 [Bacteroidetes bacterium]|nr:hypothetical protein [Bacteroidota bacterium]